MKSQSTTHNAQKNLLETSKFLFNTTTPSQNISENSIEMKKGQKKFKDSYFLYNGITHHIHGDDEIGIPNRSTTKSSETNISIKKSKNYGLTEVDDSYLLNCSLSNQNESKLNKTVLGTKYEYICNTKNTKKKLDESKELGRNMIINDDKENSRDFKNCNVSNLKITDKEANKIYFQTQDNRKFIKKEDSSLSIKERNSSLNSFSLDRLNKKSRSIDKQPKLSNLKSIVPKPSDKSKIKPKLNQINRHEPPKKARNTPICSSKEPIKKPETVVSKSTILKLDNSCDNYNFLSTSVKKFQMDSLLEPTIPYITPEARDLRLKEFVDVKAFLDKETTHKKNTKNKEFSELTDKDITELNKNFLGFYDFLIERDKSNSQLLQNLRDGYELFMKEFKNNAYLRQQQQLENEYLKEEIKKLKIEKQELENQVMIYQKEYGKLKNNQDNLDTTNSTLKSQTKNMLKEFKSDNNIVKYQENINKQINEDLIKEHKKLLNLLQKQYDMNKILLEKANKCSKFLSALKNEGFDIEKFYYEKVKPLYLEGQHNDNKLSTQNINKHIELNLDGSIFQNSDNGCNLENSMQNQNIENIQIDKQKEQETLLNEPSPSKSFTERPAVINDNQTERYSCTPCETLSDVSSQLPPDIDNNTDIEYPQEAETKAFIKSLQNKYQLNKPRENHIPMNNAKFFRKDLNNNNNNNKGVKGKLKLDLSILNDSGNNDASDVPIKQNIGFHEEFMSKFDEFSLSWRQAAMKERKF